MTEQKRPEISIIVAVYKGEKYLNGCVDAILNQTFRDFEVIPVSYTHLTLPTKLEV